MFFIGIDVCFLVGVDRISFSEDDVSLFLSDEELFFGSFLFEDSGCEFGFKFLINFWWGKF